MSRPRVLLADDHRIVAVGLEALLAAGRAGVSIDLIVRGACILPPGTGAARCSMACWLWTPKL